MKTTKYQILKKDSKSKYKDYQYIIFPHSFTDAQMSRGFDGFETTYDWLIFTLDFLKNTNKKVIIKAHPNYFKKNRGIFSDWDKKIFFSIKKRYEKNELFTFIDKSINNLDLINHLNKNCIGLTHHGTVTLEMALHNLKTISSSRAPWTSKYKISNQWSDINEYKKLLSKNWNNLKFCDHKDIDKLYYQLYFNEFSFHGKYSIHAIMKKILNKSYPLIVDNPKIFTTGNLTKNLLKQEKIFEKYFPIKNQKKFIEIFSKHIHEI